jgi:hypothetical protein
MNHTATSFLSDAFSGGLLFFVVPIISKHLSKYFTYIALLAGNVTVQRLAKAPVS